MKPVVRFIMLILVMVLAVAACKSKKKDKFTDEAYYPVVDFLKSQVASVDTSLYSILRLTERDTTLSATDSAGTSRDSIIVDTEFIHRDRFRELASDFLTLPDLADDEFTNRYTETRFFDESLNRVILTYTPKDPAKEIIQSEEVLIEPNQATGDKITNIIVKLVQNSRDSSIEKQLLWKPDQSFKVSTIRQLPGKPENVSTFKVAWNEHDYE